MVVNKNGLSLVPSVRIAVSVASPGVLSTNTSPTPRTREGIDREKPENNSPTPSATAAPKKPASAAYAADGAAGGTGGVRRTRGAWMVLLICGLGRFDATPTLGAARRFPASLG